MNRIPLSLGSLAIVVGSVFVACRAGDTPEPPGASAAAPRPEEPIAGPPDEEVAAATTPAITAQKTDKVACVMPSAPRRTTLAAKGARPHAATARMTSAKRPLEGAVASAVQREDKANLDEAIRREVESAPSQNATAPEPVGITTTTGATVPRAPSQSTFATEESVDFVNHLPSSYDVRRVRMTVDGSLVYDGLAPHGVRVPSGDHVIEVVVDYALRGSIFSPREDVHVEARTTHKVTALNHVSSITITAVQRGGVMLPLAKRVALEWTAAL